MALSHIVRITESTESGQRVQRVVADGDVPNSADSPTLVAYLAAEYDDDFLVNVLTPSMVTTVENA